MEAVFTISACLRSEKTKKACRVNQAKSFVKLCFTAEDIEHASVHNNMVASFNCKSFGILEEHSSAKWSDVFTYEENDGLVKVTVPDSYYMAPIIPGYQ
jgi:hypothetical protein